MPIAEEQALGFTFPGTRTRGIKGPDLASAATIAPTYGLNVVSGVAAISLITLPYTDFSGPLWFRPTGVWTLATGGVASGLDKPVGLAATSVVGKIMGVFYDPAAGLWYPTYTA